MFRQATLVATKIKKIRHAIDDNAFVEHLFPEEVDALRSLPLPPSSDHPVYIQVRRTEKISPIRAPIAHFIIPFPDSSGSGVHIPGKCCLNWIFAKNNRFYWDLNLQFSVHLVASFL